MRFFFVTVIASLVLVACGGGGDSADPTASVAATSTTIQPSSTTTTTEAVVGTGGLVVTYDGEACAYSGPDRATLDDEISLTFVNESEDVMFVTLRQIPPDRIDELEQLVGTDFDYSAPDGFSTNNRRPDHRPRRGHNQRLPGRARHLRGGLHPV
jgi:hypothetical protein